MITDNSPFFGKFDDETLELKEDLESLCFHSKYIRLLFLVRSEKLLFISFFALELSHLNFYVFTLLICGISIKNIKGYRILRNSRISKKYEY